MYFKISQLYGNLKLQKSKVRRDSLRLRDQIDLYTGNAFKAKLCDIKLYAVF